jgi:hypothetical protein
MSEYDNDWEYELKYYKKRINKDEPNYDEIRTEDLEDYWEPGEEVEDQFTEYGDWEPGDEPEDFFENPKNKQYSKDYNKSQLNKERNYETTRNRCYNIQDIKEVVKNINWDDVSKDWAVKYGKNQHSIKKVQLDPRQDCSRANPLYKHRKWLETVYNNKELNLSDKLISKICGVHLTTI